MARPTTVEKRIDKALELFERLVVALELRNYLDQLEKFSPSTSYTSYTCSRCGLFVTQGTYHSCWATSVSTYIQCGEHSHLGTCMLPKGHTSAHSFARVVNASG